LNKKYLSPKQLEEKYGIPKGRIYWWIREKRIFYTKIGKSVMIPDKEFKKFLDMNTIKPIYEDVSSLEN